jgi:hypothetical protein
MSNSWINWPQAIYKRSEIPVADYLMSHQKALTDEFLADFGNLKDAIETRGVANLDRRQHGVPLEETASYIQTKSSVTNEYENNVESWKSIPFRYERHDNVIDSSYSLDENSEYAKKYPTAFKLTKEFGEHCPIANYSSMAPNSILHRHTGPENRSGKYIRIHIPLIIPKGDIFLEVNGEEVDWSDLFGFNNQLAHSSHNLSSEYRLIFLIDLDRVHIGMSPGKQYYPIYEKFAKPFIRTSKEIE